LAFLTGTSIVNLGLGVKLKNSVFYSLLILSVMIALVLICNVPFYAMGEDTRQYLDIAKILEGKYPHTVSLDRLPAGFVNRTPFYSIFLCFARFFSESDAKILTLTANSIGTAFILPLILRNYSIKFGSAAAILSYLTITISFFPYFTTLSSEWICIHLLLLIGAILWETKFASSPTCGMRIGLCCACAALCRPIEIFFSILCFGILCYRGKAKNLILFGMASIPLLLHVSIQSYVAGSITFTQIPIISQYLITSQLGSVSTSIDDPPLVKDFIAEANKTNLLFSDESLTLSVFPIGVLESLPLYLDGGANQAFTQTFTTNRNISLGETHRLIALFNQRTLKENSFRYVKYLVGLWPLWLTLTVLALPAILLHGLEKKESDFWCLVIFYTVSMIATTLYSALFSLPVTRYTTIQLSPLVYVYLARCFKRFFPLAQPL
jgi:hypothetical protein